MMCITFMNGECTWGGADVFEIILQQSMNWLMIGCVYALLAVGFSLLFGVLDVIHFSHGDISMTAPFLVLSLSMLMPGDLTAMQLSLVFVVAVVITGIIGVGIERVVIRPLLNSPPLMALVTTVALGIVVRELIRHLYPGGSNPHGFTFPVDGVAAYVWNVGISWVLVAEVALTVGLLAGIWLFLHKTALGIEVRAVTQDFDAARWMGINPARIFRITFFIAAMTGGVAALLYTSNIGAVRFDFGIMVGLMGFSAAVIGGLSSVPGAILGGLLLAGIETIAQTVIPDGSSYRLVVAFLVVILFLIFKPSGLLGKDVIEKV